MKRIFGFLVTIAFVLMFYTPAAHAQFGNLPNGAAWNQYLANHPQTASELQKNPSLIYNANWRSKHPHLEEWLNNHPNDWKAMRQPSSWQDRYGAWDQKNNQWHDQDWWYHNQPQWAHEHHPEWWQQNKDWQSWQQTPQGPQAEQKYEKHQRHHGKAHDHDHD